MKTTLSRKVSPLIRLVSRKVSPLIRLVSRKVLILIYLISGVALSTAIVYAGINFPTPFFHVGFTLFMAYSVILFILVWRGRKGAGEKEAISITQVPQRAEAPPGEAEPPLMDLTLGRGLGEASAFREVYEIYVPYAYSAIEIEDGRPRYVVIEPSLSDEDRGYIEKIRQLLFEELGVSPEALGSREEAESYLKARIGELVKRHRLEVSREALEKITYYIVRDSIHYGKIDVLMRDSMIEDISCNGPDIPVYVWHRKYESLPTNVVFNHEELEAFIMKLAYKSGRHVSVASPIVDAGLPDGNRVQLTYGKEVTKKGSTFTIRKFRVDPFTISDLINFNTLTAEMAAFFWYVIEHQACVMVVGGTASGKTTTLNALSMFIRPESKIVTIEDTPELNLPHTNWISSVTRVGFGVRGGEAEVGLFELLKAAIRQRPDYIVVGEVRGEEAYTLFQAMATGHGGMGSLHAESVKAAIDRLTTEPMNIPLRLIPTLDVVAVEARTRIGKDIHRRITDVAEPYLDPESGELKVNSVFTWDPKTDSYKYSGKSLTLQEICERTGANMDEVMKELERRRVFLEWLVKEGIRSFREVGEVVKDYYANPEESYGRAKLGLMRDVGGVFET